MKGKMTMVSIEGMVFHCMKKKNGVPCRNIMFVQVSDIYYRCTNCDTIYEGIRDPHKTLIG